MGHVSHFRSPIDPCHKLESLDSPCTIREYLTREGIEEWPVPTICLYNGTPLLRPDWETAVIGDDDVVVFVSIPFGGGGGGKPILRGLAMLALVIAAAYTGGAAASLFPALTTPTLTVGAAGVLVEGVALTGTGMLVAGAISGAVIGVGTWLINMLLPLPSPSKPKQLEPSYNLQAQNNIPRLGQPIPVQYGRFRAVPDYAEPPWREFIGGSADDPQAISSAYKSEQHLYQLFCLGWGEFEIEDIQVGTQSIFAYDGIEWELYPPNTEIDLIPSAVIPVSGNYPYKLQGPNELDSNFGQVLPRTVYNNPGHIYHNQSLPTTNYTASAGSTTTISVASPTWGVDALKGQQVYIGAETDWVINGSSPNGPKPVNHNPKGNTTLVAANWNNPAATDDWNSGWTFRLAHPNRLRTIVSNSTTQITFYPALSSPYIPTAGTKFHIRQDWRMFVLNAAGTKTKKFVVDLQGPPLYRVNSKGNTYRCAIGLRIERRKIDDNGAPVAGSDGEWTPAAPLWQNWEPTDPDSITDSIYNTYEGLIKGRPDDGNGVCVTRQCNVALWGPSNKTSPVQLSLAYDLPSAARWEVRIQRSTYFWDDTKTSNEISLMGIRCFIRDNRKYPNVSTLALVTKATNQTMNVNRGNVGVICTRKIKTYSPGNTKTLGTFSLSTVQGSDLVQVIMASHRAAIGQTIKFTGILQTVGGYSTAVWNRTQGHTVDSIIDKNNFYIKMPSDATASTTGPSAGTFTSQLVGPFWSAVVPTSSIAWAAADAITNQKYGVGALLLEDTLAEYARLHETWMDRGDEFNGRFESARRAREAIDQILRVGRAKSIRYCGEVLPVRDEPRTVARMAFTDRNIRTLNRRYVMKKSSAPDGVRATFVDRRTWTENVVEAGIDGADPDRPGEVDYFGITDAQHAWREAAYEAAQDHYRRTYAIVTSEYEGYLAKYGDLVPCAFTEPAWGQSGDVAAYDNASFRITTSEELNWECGDPLILDPGFAIGTTTEWGTVGADTTLSVSGGALRVNANAASTQQAMARQAANVPDLSQGTRYKVTGRCRAGLPASAGRVVTIGIYETGGASAVQNSTGVITMTLTESWQEFTAYGQIIRADRTAAYARLGATTGNIAQPNDIYEFDNVQVSLAEGEVDHVMALVKDDGSLLGPVFVTRVDEFTAQLPGGLIWTPTTSRADREPTRYLFGRSDRWAAKMIMHSINPVGDMQYNCTLVAEDDRVHEADGATYIPPDPMDPTTLPAVPVVEHVEVSESGRAEDRMVVVSWSAAAGADYYEVEVGSFAHMRSIQVSYVIGSFAAKTPLEAYGPEVYAARISSLTTTNGSSIVTATLPNGYAAGGWIFIQGAPSVGGIASSAMNGRRQVISANQNEIVFSASASATASTSIASPNLQIMERKVSSFYAVRPLATGDRRLFYIYPGPDGIEGAYMTVGGIPELVQGMYIVSKTASTNFCIAKRNSEVAEGSWTRLASTRETSAEARLLEVAPQAIDTAPGDVDEVVTARVRGVGMMAGQWAYSKAVRPRAVTVFRPAFDQSGRPLHQGALGQRLCLYGLLDGASASKAVLLGYLPPNAMVLQVDWIEEALFSGGDGSNPYISIGDGGDTESYLTYIFVGGTGVYRGSYSLAGGTSSVGTPGTRFGKKTSPYGDGAVYAFVQNIGGFPTTGRAWVTLTYVVLPESDTADLVLAKDGIGRSMI